MRYLKYSVLPILAGLVIGTCAYAIPKDCSAALVTAYEQQVDEKYVVDTSSIYRPDANHISVLVYYSESFKNISDQKYTYKFRYDDNKWWILEHKSKGGPEDIREDDTHYWAVVEPNSIAQDVLRVVTAYS